MHPRGAIPSPGDTGARAARMIDPPPPGYGGWRPTHPEDPTMAAAFDRGPVTGILFDLVERDGTCTMCTTLESALEVASRPSVDASHVRVVYTHPGARVTIPRGERISLRSTALAIPVEFDGETLHYYTPQHTGHTEREAGW